jgi:hypothetical protein
MALAILRKSVLSPVNGEPTLIYAETCFAFHAVQRLCILLTFTCKFLNVTCHARVKTCEVVDIAFAHQR